MTADQITAATEFGARFRGSIFWRDVRRGLAAAIGDRMHRKVATEKERETFGKLRGEWSDGDGRPPIFGISLSTETLWPPDGRMVPMVVSVHVSGGIDPQTEVRLESITCIDGVAQPCRPWEDIIGADYGTDDREFELRAWQPDSNTPRVYTITYSVTDAAGSKNKDAKTVAVALDRRGKRPQARTQ